MSSNATAEVRTFPHAKVQPSTEAPEVPVQPAAPVATPAAEAPAKKKRSVRSLLLPIIGLALLGAGSWYGYNYWTDGRFMISTDDAYVQADMSFVSPKISGYIDKVLVGENQKVKAGDPLFVIDNGDYKIAVAQAEAQIATLAKTLDRIDAQTKAAQASLSQAQAQKVADQAAADNAARAQDRAAQLLKTHVGTQAQLDDAQTALDQAKAALVGADAQIAAAQANIGVLEAQRAESASTLASLQLTRDKAERDLSFTVLKAPYDGVVGNRSVEQGDLVSPGQKLAVVVPMDKLYIVGNFKETQLGPMVPGEKVRITVDAIDGQSFQGTVSSLAPASGAVFSLLPPENATGNFTKVVQRVPVRIDVPADVLKTGKLRAGLSVVVAVDSRTAPASTTN
ncbi:MAG: HlyD family secretion protein [Mesorhizobium sp.]|uniref:HlyD family secretion protein n=1 Tax=Mesorhizobium sp. TaxID=1871066 RepID=UPI000FE4D738|nr:HlyD family secretion protein [Mesorhizobium sp.]RWM17604.1 MAG: HlyD family secretion protein [Mesorhizobium sp.]